jgi:hypothetical protein
MHIFRATGLRMIEPAVANANVSVAPMMEH